MLAGEGEGDAERVEDLRLVLDDLLRRAAGDGKAVDRDDQERDEEQAHAWLSRELHIVQPKLIVAMGQDAVACLNAARFPLAAEVASEPGTIQKFTPTIEALVCPDLDASLDDATAKREFWDAFKAIGPWWSELPPY